MGEKKFFKQLIIFPCWKNVVFKRLRAGLAELNRGSWIVSGDKFYNVIISNFSLDISQNHFHAHS